MKVMKGKKEQTKGNWLYITSSKSCERKGKKTKVNNHCITSLKNYERGENIQPLFHPHSPSRHKRKKKPHISSPKYMFGQHSKCGLSTHNFYIFTDFAPSLTSKHTRRRKNLIPSPKLLDYPHIYKGVNGFLNKNFVDNL